jgi:hypothetical protein
VGSFVGKQYIKNKNVIITIVSKIVSMVVSFIIIQRAMQDTHIYDIREVYLSFAL